MEATHAMPSPANISVVPGVSAMSIASSIPMMSAAKR